MAVAINWGPALVVLFGFVLTVVYNAHHFDKRFDLTDKRIDDLRDTLKSEIRRVEDRMVRIEDRIDRIEARVARIEERLEHPIYRP
jgi:septation ring formation regulator EzrA